MGPVNAPTCGETGDRGYGAPTAQRSGRSVQGNFGFDASAWDAVAVLAAQVEERFQRRVRQRIEEVLDLLGQVEGGAGLPPGLQEIRALAFCLVDELVAGSGVPAATRARLLQMVACHALPVDKEFGGGASTYWFYLNLMLKRFQQSRTEEGLETAVSAALGVVPRF